MEPVVGLLSDSALALELAMVASCSALASTAPCVYCRKPPQLKLFLHAPVLQVLLGFVLVVASLTAAGRVILEKRAQQNVASGAIGLRCVQRGFSSMVCIRTYRRSTGAAF